MTIDLEKLSEQRYTAKVYDKSRKIAPEQLQQLLALLRNTPSSVNSQPWHFFVVGSDEGKKTIEPAMLDFNKPRVLDASHVIVFAVRTSMDDAYLDHLLEQDDKYGRFRSEEDRAAQHGGRSFFVGLNRDKDLVGWETKQAYIALGSLLFGAAALGIDATPIEGFKPAEMDEALGLREKGLTSVLVASLGYSSEDDFNARLPKSRLPQEELFTFL